MKLRHAAAGMALALVLAALIMARELGLFDDRAAAGGRGRQGYGGRTLAVRLHRKMLSVGVPPTRHHDPALSRQPGANRSPDRGLRYTHEGAERGAESDRSQALIFHQSALVVPTWQFFLVLVKAKDGRIVEATLTCPPLGW